MDSIYYDGSEEELSDCLFNEWGPDKCFHREDAGVVCIIIDNKTDSVILKCMVSTS